MTAALAAFTFFSLTPAHAALNTDERTVLVNLYNGTGGSSWAKNTNWNVTGTSDPCADKWYGVTCDAAGEHVTVLDFESNNLSGSLPDLSPLTQLVKAAFWYNNLTGTIPPLPDSLEYLDVGENNLTGSLPLKLPASLMTFYASYNQLTGSIPELPANFEFFGASNNQLSGSIPKLPASLWLFNAENNFLSGEIPVFPASLTDFYVAGNFLTGLPPEPNNVNWASMCPNKFDAPTGTPDWSAVTWDPTTSEWTANCAPATSATVTVDNTVTGGSITCPTSVPYAGGSCTVTTDTGYVFAKELVFDPVDAAAVESCTDTGCTILVKKDVTVKAVFTKVPDPTPTRLSQRAPDG